jgi:hypothetical protein
MGKQQLTKYKARLYLKCSTCAAYITCDVQERCANYEVGFKLGCPYCHQQYTIHCSIEPQAQKENEL